MRNRTELCEHFMDQPRKVVYTHSNPPDQNCIYSSCLQTAQEAYLVFHQSRSDAVVLADNMPSSDLDKVVSLQGDVLLERKTLTSNELEATKSRHIDSSAKTTRDT